MSATSVPDFMLIGASKSATSSIVDWLRQHPGVFVTDPKEPNFFNRDDNYAKGLHWYRQKFAQASPQQLLGEASNLYTAMAMYPNTVERIAQMCGPLRFVYSVRDPIERIRSLWIQLRAQAGGDEVEPDINRAIHRQWDLLIDTSCYSRQLDAFDSAFGRESTLVVLYEDFRSNPLDVMRRICDHIGVAASGLLETPLHKNRSEGKTLVSPWLGRLRWIPGSRVVRKCMPEGIKRVGREMLPRVKAEGTSAELSWQSIARIKAWVADDSRRLLQRLGREYTVWPTAC